MKCSIGLGLQEICSIPLCLLDICQCGQQITGQGSNATQLEPQWFCALGLTPSACGQKQTPWRLVDHLPLSLCRRQSFLTCLVKCPPSHNYVPLCYRTCWSAYTYKPIFPMDKHCHMYIPRIQVPYIKQSIQDGWFLDYFTLVTCPDLVSLSYDGSADSCSCLCVKTSKWGTL